jgi:hypothetical protein
VCAISIFIRTTRSPRHGTRFRRRPDPTRQAAALIRPGSPALVVFRDQTELAWLRWLARGFRHCAVVVRVGGDWVLIDSLSHSICVGRFAAEPISGLAARGKTPDWRRNPTTQDNSDGLGLFIATWDVATLGDRPTAADGFFRRA